MRNIDILDIDEFVFNMASRELFKRSSGARIQLQPKPAIVLAKLIERRGELVTREQLVEAGWAGTVVSYDLALNTCIRQIRAALGDQAANPRYIETVPRRGYRFIGRSQPARKASSSTRFFRDNSSVRIRVIIAVLLAGLALTVVASLTDNDTVETTVRVEPVRQLVLEPKPSSSVLAAVLEESIRTASVKAGNQLFRVVAPHEFVPDSDHGGTDGHAPVDYVVTSALDIGPDGYRLNVQISRTDDSVILWAGQFRPECPDAVDPVRQIAAQVSTALVHLLPPRNRLLGATLFSHGFDFAHSAQWGEVEYSKRIESPALL